MPSTLPVSLHQRVSAFVFAIASLFLLLGCKPPNAYAAEADCAMDGTCQQLASAAKEPLECSVYMAPSTLGVDTSMGIYTGIPLKDGTQVNFPEIVIPLLFREFGDHVKGYDDGVLWDRYVWEGEVMDMETYIDTNRHASRAVFVPGVGCTINSVLDMSNIQSTHGSNYSTAGLHRSSDPGAGAFTPYYNSQTVASTDLPAGAELFASYGDYWIPDIPGAQVALEALLDDANDFLQNKYYPFIRDHDQELSPQIKQALWNFTNLNFPIESKALSNLPRKVPWSEIEAQLKQAEAAIATAAATKATKGDEDEEDSTANSVVREFIRRQSVQSVEWLQQNGYCQDHLKPGISKIPQAGRGAFAFRNLPAGTVVGYAPLVHVGLHGRDIFTVQVGDDAINKQGNESASPPPRKQYDLVINYSFGHRNSTVLLTPYGAGVNYINHGGKGQANVKLRWPDKELIAHKPGYLLRTPLELSNTLDKIGLSFEYVAMRDIAEGEEVLMDYGPEWEEAWAQHVAQWEPVPNSSSYMHSTDWSEKDTFRTLVEQETNPYPSNLHTMCQESYSLGSDGVTYVWVDMLRTHPYRVYCDVIERYEVTILNDDSSEESVTQDRYAVELELDDGTVFVVRDVPYSAIFLFDKVFSADWHLPNVFRHEIAIPDDIMPIAWMNGPPTLP